MPEKKIDVNINPKGPSLVLARTFSKKVFGTTVSTQLPHEDNNFQGAISLITTNEDQADDILDAWEAITETNDFRYLEAASRGDVQPFVEGKINKGDLIIANNQKGHDRFYNFLAKYAYQQAIENASFEENHLKIRQLKIDMRQQWISPLSGLQKRFAPNYIQSVVERLHNLITTGEEKRGFKDKILDFIF